MNEPKPPTAVVARDVAPRTKISNYPEPFNSRMAGREKRPLGDIFKLQNFGVNLTRLAPGGVSALRHAHARQDEFIYILKGSAVLVTDSGQATLTEGMCAGFRAGDGNAHQLANRTADEVVYLEVGDRTAGDEVTYPDDDIEAVLTPEGWRFNHKDGSAY